MKKIIYITVSLLVFLNCPKNNSTEPEPVKKWVTVNNGLTDLHVQALAADPENANVIYAGTFKGVFKTTDGARNWVKLEGVTYGDVRSIVINPDDSQIIYAATYGGGIFKSANEGKNWIGQNSGLSDLRVFTIVIANTNPQTIYAGTIGGRFKSVNAGEAWHFITNNWSANWAQSLAVDAHNSEIIYVGTDSRGIFKSTDGGLNFKSINRGLNSSYPIWSIIIHPEYSDILFVGNSKDFFLSEDEGETWSNYTSELSSLAVRCCLLSFDKVTTLYAGTGKDIYCNNPNGVFVSIDNGKNWAAMNNGLINLDTRCLAKSANKLYAGSWGDGVFCFNIE